VIEIVGRAAEDAEEVVIAALERLKSGRKPRCHLPDQRGAVAGLLEIDGRVGWLGGRPMPGRGRVNERLLELELQPHLVAAG